MEQAFRQETLGKIRQFRDYRKLMMEVNRAPDLKPFSFSKITGDSRVLLETGEIVAVEDRELGVDTAYELSLNTEQQYALLRALQKLGFDVFQIASMPKGEKYCVVHDNLPKLNNYLSGEDLPKAGPFLALRNKAVSPTMLRHGRLHVRFYSRETDPSKLVAIAHVDPPNIEHFNLFKHFHNSIRVDYKKGGELFQRTLTFLGGMSEMPEVV